jgi:hypothetical protein
MIFNETDTEVVTETEEETEEETTEEETPKEEKPKETLEQREARLARQLEQTRKKLGKEEPQKTEQPSNEPDYAKLGFLNSQSVTHPDDQKLVMDEANRLKLPLTDVLQMEHIKSRLATNNDARVSQDGMPKGSGRKGGAGKSTVDYYLAHPDEVPDDLELHNKVIDAKMKKETNSNMFSSTPFTG